MRILARNRTQAEYARPRSIHAGTLMGWASRLARSDMSKTHVGARVFVPVVTSQHHDEVGSRGGQVSAEIILTSGRRVRLSGDFSIEQLGRLLDVVEAGGQC